jgi:hypothetical protein
MPEVKRMVTRNKSTNWRLGECNGAYVNDRCFWSRKFGISSFAHGFRVEYRRILQHRVRNNMSLHTSSTSLGQVFQAAAFWQSLVFVLRHPPLGNDFVDAQFSHNRSPLRLKFSGYILNRDARELESHSLFCVREIVISMRQISIANKTAGSRSRKI